MRLRPESKQETIDRLERERVEASNGKRDIERQRSYVSQCDLDLHNTRERVAELRKEIERIEKQELPKRERKLTAARVTLVQMECAIQ